MRGLTQREAAQAAGVDANTIWRYEAGVESQEVV